MKPEDFEFIVSMLKAKSGLVLGPDKVYLLESRLMPLARKKGFKGIDDLIVQIRRRNLPLEKEVVDAMTTNESFFFRDTKPFDHFRKVVLPNLIKTRIAKRSFRIWCAAASSGQEPYSLAMIIKEEAAALAGWHVDIVATDISQDILKKARAGLYSQFEVQRGMSADYLIKYFKKNGDAWELSLPVRSMVQFKEWNLLEDLRTLGVFDVVFCRNVLLYFDQKTKGDVLDRISRTMADDGCLYLGGAETVLGISSSFKPIPQHSSVYALTRNPSAGCIGISEPSALPKLGASLPTGSILGPKPGSTTTTAKPSGLAATPRPTVTPARSTASTLGDRPSTTASSSLTKPTIPKR